MHFVVASLRASLTVLVHTAQYGSRLRLELHSNLKVIKDLNLGYNVQDFYFIPASERHRENVPILMMRERRRIKGFNTLYLIPGNQEEDQENILLAN